MEPIEAMKDKQPIKLVLIEYKPLLLLLKQTKGKGKFLEGLRCLRWVHKTRNELKLVEVSYMTIGPNSFFKL